MSKNLLHRFAIPFISTTVPQLFLYYSIFSILIFGCQFPTDAFLITTTTPTTTNNKSLQYHHSCMLKHLLLTTTKKQSPIQNIIHHQSNRFRNHHSVFSLMMSGNTIGLTRGNSNLKSNNSNKKQRTSFKMSTTTSELSPVNEESRNSSSTSTKYKPLVIIITGPTGVGKSDTAYNLCKPETTKDILLNHFKANNNAIDTDISNLSNNDNNDISSYQGHIISADSVQAYTGVNIGANKPTTKELEQTPHHLVNFIPLVKPKDISSSDNTSIITSTYNANEWTNDARKIIQSLETATHEIPIVVGGTMMYLEWLVNGKPDAMKPTKEAIQKAQNFVERFQTSAAGGGEEEEKREQSWKNALEELENMNKDVNHKDRIDSIFLERILKLPGNNDWYRLRRILEVAYTYHSNDNSSGNNEKVLPAIDTVFTGERKDALSDFGYDVRCFFLCPDDRMLHTSIIDYRCEVMLTRGLFKEAADLYCQGIFDFDDNGNDTNQQQQSPNQMIAKAIGYRQVLDYLTQDTTIYNNKNVQQSFDEFLDKFTTATRQYAKKQMAWFRKDDSFVFIPVPLSLSSSDNNDGNDKEESVNQATMTMTTTTSKEERVHQATQQIYEMCIKSRQDFELELIVENNNENDNDSSSTPLTISQQTKQNNAKQAKKMKFYKPTRYLLKQGSPELEQVLKEAELCKNMVREYIENRRKKN